MLSKSAPKSPVEFTFDIARAARLLHALSNPVRIRIVTMLLEQDLDVGHISKGVGLGQSATSQHLRILRDSEIVTTRRDAQWVYYSLQDPGAARLLEVVRLVVAAPAAGSSAPSKIPHG